MSPEQVRMARALLRLTTRDLALAAKVNKDTVVAIEAGRKGHAGPVAKIREFFESKGVFFIPALDTMHGPAVALRWGVEPPGDERDEAEAGQGAATSGGESGPKAMAWDEEEEAHIPLNRDDIDGLLRYWAEGGRWARLSEPSRKALRRAMGQAPMNGVNG